MRLSAGERVKQARIALVLDAPFFGVLASRLVIVEDLTCKTMWTDSVSVGYSPAWVDTISDHELKGTWVHEVLHVSNGHCWRMDNRNHEDWNDACDRSIYGIIMAAGFVMPEGVLDNKGFENMPAELIYEKIKKLRPPQQPQQPQQSKDSSGDGKDQQQGGGGQGDQKDDQSGSQDDGSGQGGKPSKKGGKGKGKGKGADKGQEKDGSASDPAGQQPPKKPAVAGEIRPAPKGVDPKVLESEWKIAVNNAANFAASQGDMPGYLKDLVDEIQKPLVDWKEALWAFVQQSIYSPDYKWTRPNRNYMPSGLYLPSLIGEEMPEIVVSEDTSYSVYKALTRQFRGEMSAVMEQMRPRKIYHLQADTRITKITEMEPGDEWDNEVAGRGGTDFRPTFDWVRKEGLEPACLLYMSDLDGPFPEKEPDYPVLWVCPPGSPNPPWGMKLEIPFDQYKQAKQH